MNQIINTNNDVVNEITLENRLEVTFDYLRKSYLTNLNEMQIVPIKEIIPLEDDLIENVRLYKITEMVYQKGELVTDKFTTVFNSLATYNTSVFVVIDSDGQNTNVYLGVRNNENNDEIKRSTVTLGDTLKNTLIGNFPGVKIINENRSKIKELCNKISRQNNVTSVSVVANQKNGKEHTNEEFVQGLEKLVLSMDGRQFIGLIIAENQASLMIQEQRKFYQNLYTQLSPLQKEQYSTSESTSENKSQSFFEMNGKQKAAMITSAGISLASVICGGIIGSNSLNIGLVGGSMVGAQIASQLNGFITSLAPTEQLSKQMSSSISTTTENKAVTDMLQLLDESIKRTNEFDSYGMWNVAGYFISNDMSTAEIAASNYRSLMNGENSGREVSAINSWRKCGNINGNFDDLTTYLSRFIHPLFYYWGNNGIITASTAISGKELGLHLGLPRATIPGLAVIEHAEFGKEVTTYSLFDKIKSNRPEDRMTLGKVFDLGKITNKIVELDNKSLNMHTFITGSTGSGKSNTVYQMLNELHQDKIPFLVIEPAKGEYKDVFGNWNDVNVYSTNPNVAELININPFMFPKSIHVLEHVDGLVEIFSVCWPMYDAMPAFFKDAILKSYEYVGWDLGSSTFEGEQEEYPDFEVLVEQLELLIDSSDYASDIKSNYRGALITRVKSLTVGLNKFIFTKEQTPYSKLFDDNCILDISRVKSSETKALIMGLAVYILNEYRVDTKTLNNNGLKHVTVLEEAHNLLKNTSSMDSALIGKSVEMLTNTIAEIRTYGEGFIIVDQSPSSVDIAAIKNTNTKIVLRTPEANDREAIGRSIGLTADQVNEIAKLPSGVAVVYQNDWVSPVLTMVNKADIEEMTYEYRAKTSIKPLKEARMNIIRMILQPWIGDENLTRKELMNDLKSMEINRIVRKELEICIENYAFCGRKLFWNIDEQEKICKLILAVLGINKNQLAKILASKDCSFIKNQISSKLTGANDEDINEIVVRIMKGIN